MRNALNNRRSIKGKAHLRKAFKSAKSTDEMLKVFNKMESCFQEQELCMECFTLATKLLSEKNLEKAVSFGKRALKILIDFENENLLCPDENAFGFLFNHMNISNPHCDHMSSLTIACILLFLGFVSLELKRFGECLAYLTWGVRNLSTLRDMHTSCPGKCVLRMLLATELLLVKVKLGMGKEDELVVHFRMILDLKEQTMEEGCVSIGEATEDLYCAYFVIVKDSEKALPFCLKALEIYTKHFGVKSVKVAKVRKQLVEIYKDLGEYEKAVEQARLSQRGRRTCLDLIDIGIMLVELGRYEEVVDVFKGVVSRTNGKKELRAFALVYMAKAYFNLEKFEEAKKCLRTACEMLEKNEMDPTFVPIASGEMSELYEKMNDLDTAISLMRKAVAIPELSPELLAQSCSRLFMLVSKPGKDNEGIPYIEDAVEKLKKNFGPDHCLVAGGYRVLGVAYLRSGQQLESAVKLVENAKDIMDVTLGPHHFESLITSAALSLAYANLGRFQTAIEIQEKVVEGFNSLGPSQHLDAAVKELNHMKRHAESPTGSSPQPKHSEDLCSAISECGLGD